MTLVKCPECGKKVSDSANSCPHCGYELRKQIYKKIFNPETIRIKYLLGLILVSVGLYFTVEVIFPNFISCPDRFTANECVCIKRVVEQKVGFWRKIKMLFSRESEEIMYYVGVGDAIRCAFVDINESSNQYNKANNQPSTAYEKDGYGSTNHLRSADYDDEKYEGVRREYYENGKIYSESTYKNGKLDGLSKIYYETGRIKSEAYYKNGVLDGFEKVYYANGQLQFEGKYKNGKKHGICIWYNMNGNILSKVTFKADAIVE